jgi:amidohydrolase
VSELLHVRRRLHSLAELAGKEKATSQFIQSFLTGCKPDALIADIGGHGVAAVFKGRDVGPRLLVRCELDALPIPETIDLAYGSTTKGVSHKCGHDGHMTIAAGLAAQLGTRKPARGSVVVLFQPAEETGEGARLVIEDPAFVDLHPDYVFALHNLPGYPLRQVVMKSGVFASASSGLTIHLQGQTSHAAEPEAGRSPALAVAQLIQLISALPQFHTSLHQAAQATVIHARLGEIAFGTSPGEGELMATLRSHSPLVMDTLITQTTTLANKVAHAHDLLATIGCTQVFPATNNDDDAVRVIEESAKHLGLDVVWPTIPFAWSEDFGHFTARYRGAMFGLGTGQAHPALHHPEYDFPERLLEPGIKLFSEIIHHVLGG